MAFWETGDQEFFQGGTLIFLTEDFVLISSTSDYAPVPHFFRCLFYCSLDCRAQEISAVDKDSSEV